MDLQDVSREAVVLFRGTEAISVGEKKQFQIRSIGPGGTVTYLEETVPNGKVWNVFIQLQIKEEVG